MLQPNRRGIQLLNPTGPFSLTNFEIILQILIF